MTPKEAWVEIFGLKLNYARSFSVFGFDIYWYGVIIALGFALAVWYAFRRAKYFDIDPDKLIDALLVTAPAAIIGARLYFIAFNNEISIAEFFDFRNGGLGILGAVVFAVAAGFVMCRIRKINFIDAMDLTAIGFFIGQGVGRWGNFINQEAFVYDPNIPGFMTGNIIQADMIGNYGFNAPVHPCFLYESIWCLGGFLLLHKMSKNRKFKGQLALMYMIWYGFGRFFIEWIRTDSLVINEIKVSSLLSAMMVLAGISVYVIASKRASRLSPVLGTEGEDEPVITKKMKKEMMEEASYESILGDPVVTEAGEGTAEGEPAEENKTGEETENGDNH